MNELSKSLDRADLNPRGMTGDWERLAPADVWHFGGHDGHELDICLEG
jgi:hypothetical protein